MFTQKIPSNNEQVSNSNTSKTVQDSPPKDETHPKGKTEVGILNEDEQKMKERNIYRVLGFKHFTLVTDTHET